jgi:hypothetical protein
MKLVIIQFHLDSCYLPSGPCSSTTCFQTRDWILTLLRNMCDASSENHVCDSCRNFAEPITESLKKRKQLSYACAYRRRECV